jgi:hypothetical protein
MIMVTSPSNQKNLYKNTLKKPTIINKTKHHSFKNWPSFGFRFIEKPIGFGFGLGFPLGSRIRIRIENSFRMI